MVVNEQLENLVSRNGMDLIEIENIIYNTLLLSVFESICLKMKNPIVKQKLLSLFHKERNHVALVKQISLDLTGCLLIEMECELILRWLIAYFRKDGRRKVYSKAYKLDILTSQNHMCKICDKQITYENSQLDHVIPWDYVGVLLASTFGEISANYFTEFIPVYFSHLTARI